ncbi:MAG TPA: hypothetical protein DD381_10500 [Lentisphaeria bacterium]|nr:MAG: hypothetical protein A2X47_02170 [Lentisphaerae bacterium GWF2_38_69]HBM16756.1 hypothetical protein [Lentisphaeria bacterium]
MKQKSKILNFSEDFIRLEYVESAETCVLTEQTIVVNLRDRDSKNDSKLLKPFKSAVYSNIKFKNVENLLFITLKTELFSNKGFPFSKEIMSSWKQVYEVFPVPSLKNIKLWRSEKERIGKIELNLWFASAGTNCGIHNEHDFSEIHAQIFGLGRIQIFHNKEFSSLHQEIYLGPGYTHDPLCSETKIYPYHQYYADTDCLWLAIEIYD